MRHLSALDALFLQLETPETPMHVGSLMLLRRGRAGARRDAYGAIREHLARRIHLAPVFSRRLASIPGDIASPAWLRVGEVDLDYHVRRLRLPKPGSPAQLNAAVARLHELPLDRERPLWQVTVIEGLASGEVGYYSKVHHAALDGQGGIAVAQAILDASMAAGPDNGWVANTPDVLAKSKLIDAGETITIEFTAPSKPGDYPYVCTFPGHASMRGVLKVTP